MEKGRQNLEDDEYLTLSSPSEGFYKEKGSKFLAFAHPIHNGRDAEGHVAALVSNYPDARHVCYAYVLDKPSGYYRANDDGEPANTAGTPILGQIRSFGLHNVLVAVVRYFGGTKLGVGGLIHAYKSATAQALSHATIEKAYLTSLVGVSYPYERTSAFMQLVNRLGINITGQTFEAECSARLEIRQSMLSEARKAFAEHNFELVNL